jgi:hypothetical protein
MPPIGVQKPNGSKNLKGNFKRNQVAHLWGWTTKLTKFN